MRNFLLTGGEGWTAPGAPWNAFVPLCEKGTPAKQPFGKGCVTAEALKNFTCLRARRHAKMGGGGKGVPGLLVVLVGLAASGSCYQITEGPKNATALEGSEARFNCTVSQGWRLIMWALNGTVILSVTPKEPIITNDRFTSASYEVGGDFVSEMIIHDVQLNDSGRITCSLQNSDRDASAFLSVQVVGDLSIPTGGLVVPEDEPCNVTCRVLGWSPLPDVTWDISAPVRSSSYSWVPNPDDPGSALSILSLTPQGSGTLTCLADLKGLNFHKSVTVNLTVIQPPVESGYQSKLRKSSDVKTNNGTFETKTKSGNENHGYNPYESRISKTSSLHPKSYEFSVLEQRGSQQPHQGSAEPHPAPVNRPHVSFDMASPKKIRNVTLV
ncbi:immunoglobulin superfamily member 5 isoform X2 [Choloepus didactylus]|uniref:immunoglobulin superfamily member 5 isoform X2 n=1 Tax=Choloepus didactylus TaxID=27675 RepID=UPI00189F4852|nr:immunoglobulin superfamily member 5 isoform X2 [Choloepus didactylus]